MANAILGTRNLIDKSELYAVVLTRGSWETTLPLENLKSERMVDSARSTDATTASTQYEISYTVPRTLKMSAIPRGNFGIDARVRNRYTTTPKFNGVTVNGVNTAGASSISLAAGVGGATVTSGDYFTIAGDNTTYKVTSTQVIAASSTASVSITPNLAETTAGAEVVTCRSGDYTNATRDSGWVDVWKVIFPFGTLPYGHPSAYNGKADEEERQRISPAMPAVDIVPDVEILASYQLVEIDDTTNPAGFLDLERHVSCSGWQPSINVAYGFNLGRNVNTEVDRSLGGARYYTVRPGERAIGFNLDNIPFEEGMVYFNQFQDEIGIHNQVLFVMDPDDEVNYHRTIMLCNLERLERWNIPYYRRLNSPFNLLEVIE